MATDPDQPSAPPRIAYFPDSFHEVNGVAHTSRHFEAFARRHNLPFLCVRAGAPGDRSSSLGKSVGAPGDRSSSLGKSAGAPSDRSSSLPAGAGLRSQALSEDGNVWTLELPRGVLSFALEKDLRYDPVFWRHIPLIDDVIARFRPDLIHITGPSEIGMLGALLAHRLGLPLAASWHTNVHEYLARRSEWLFRFLPPHKSAATEQTIEDVTFAAASRFYSIARVLFAPNPELRDKLERASGRPCYRMPRGVDSRLFHPSRRTRPVDDNTIVLGFVGRLSVEKNIAGLVTVHDELVRMGLSNFRFLIVGHGGDEAWLRERLHHAEFTGVLRGEELARAYANMDLFVFPSHTDTFGNVVLEALSSGVPAIVTPDGGPKTIVRDGETGRIVPDAEFAPAIAAILSNASLHNSMRHAARNYALTASWDSVFEGVYTAYDSILPRRTVAAG